MLLQNSIMAFMVTPKAKLVQEVVEILFANRMKNDMPLAEG